MKTYDIAIELTTDMLGTVPKNREVYTSYIESKRPDDGANEPEAETVDEIEEKGWTGFHADEHGLFIYDYFLKGFIKNAGNVMKDELGIKALRSKLTDYVFITPRRVYLGKASPDGVVERPLRAQTMQGPRVTLARSDMVRAGTSIVFSLTILPNPHKIDIALIERLLEYGQYQGLGQFRNGGYGRFKVVACGELVAA